MKKKNLQCPASNEKPVGKPGVAAQSIISALRRQRQEDCKFKTTPTSGHLVRHNLRTKQYNSNNKEQSKIKYSR
jgi:hypothetical protein